MPTLPLRTHADAGVTVSNGARRYGLTVLGSVQRTAAENPCHLTTSATLATRVQNGHIQLNVFSQNWPARPGPHWQAPLTHMLPLPADYNKESGWRHSSVRGPLYGAPLPVHVIPRQLPHVTVVLRHVPFWHVWVPVHLHDKASWFSW
jgi:hypothetical protein